MVKKEHLSPRVVFSVLFDYLADQLGTGFDNDGNDLTTAPILRILKDGRSWGHWPKSPSVGYWTLHPLIKDMMPKEEKPEEKSPEQKTSKRTQKENKSPGQKTSKRKQKELSKEERRITRACVKGIDTTINDPKDMRRFTAADRPHTPLQIISNNRLSPTNFLI